MKDRELNCQSGISIVEILIVLTMAAILTTIAIMQLGRSKTDLQRQSIAREFKVYLERARFDSVKRRAANPNDMAKIELSDSFFTAFIDFDGNGTLDSANEKRKVDFTERSSTQILASATASSTLVYPVKITFDQRGHITAKDSSSPAQDVNPVFTICSSGSCSGASPDTTVISISTTGTVAVLKSDQSLSALPTPSPNSTATPQFNCYVLVNANSAPCLNK